MTPWTTYESPLGPLTLLAGAGGLTALRFPGRGETRDEVAQAPERFADALAQLDEYFAGTRTSFDLALDLGGTPFQRRVWDALRAIPYGETTTYGRVAEAVGRPDRVRAVGATVGRTPVPIVVPCHRVIGADGSLTGYGGGLRRKRALLDHERDVAAGLPASPAPRQLVLL